MMEFITAHGYTGMFIMGFLAASIIPLGSEWLLVLLLLKGADPVYLTVSAAAGNYLGACTTYAIGYYGSGFAEKRIFRISSDRKERAERVYKKYGAWSLLFSWLPVVGDPLCLVSGLFRYNFTGFSILVLTGKAGRYAFLAYITLKSAEYLK